MSNYHDEARRILRDEWYRLANEIRITKGEKANECRADPYGRSGADLMKKEHMLRKQFKSIDLSLKVLHKDAQARIQYDWEMEQAEIQRKLEGSYNCLGGC